MSDVLDILEVERAGAGSQEINKDRIIGPQRVAKKPGSTRGNRRPEGINRELYALLYGDNKDPPPLFPTQDVNKGYKQTKAKLGMRRVRPWRWTSFVNPARSDGLVLHHWRRTPAAEEEEQEYVFAKFNKKAAVVSFTDQEYQRHLQADGWSKAETEHLFDLCRRFDLRFIVMQDRWDRAKFSDRSVEDLKGRYYSICSTLNKLRAEPGQPQPKEFAYDAVHERKRKQQLKRLFSRSPKQIEEEQHLLAELRKIEARKRERERKTQDLQKLINSADTEHRRLQKTTSAGGSGSGTSGSTVRKKVANVSSRPPRDRVDSTSSGGDAAGGGSIKFPDLRGSGVSLRSQRMKLPASIGQKKAKAIEQLVQELGIEMSPMPTEAISGQFNELRNDMLLLYELKMGLSSCEFELQTLKHQYEALAPGKTLDIPATVTPSGLDINRPKTISEVLDIHGGQGTPTRKRKAALEQSKVLHKIKTRT